MVFKIILIMISIICANRQSLLLNCVHITVGYRSERVKIKRLISIIPLLACEFQHSVVLFFNQILPHSYYLGRLWDVCLK